MNLNGKMAVCDIKSLCCVLHLLHLSMPYLTYLCVILRAILIILFSVKDKLRNFGVNTQTPQCEFVDRLSAFPLDSLKVLRTDLFHKLSSLDVIPADLRGIPLHDSALCSLSQILSTDCWTLCKCILPITENLTEKWEERQISCRNPTSPICIQSRHVENLPVSTSSHSLPYHFGWATK